jgi:hypothetical protein
MARKLKTDLWKKAYLIEFVDQSGKLLDAFTFSVPPESEEITYSQRKSETKTFGGLHVDDYGMDAVKISLSGSTVNQDLKKIYNPKWAGADKWMTGEQEIYYLRDLIHTYKTGENRNKEIRIMLYDLSKMNLVMGQSMDSAIKNYWRVFPGDFKIRRSSDRPFAYKYSIEFTAVDFEDGENIKGPLPEWLGFIKTALDNIKGFSDTLKKGMDYVNNIEGVLEDINSSIRDLTVILDVYADILNGYIDSAANMVDTANDIMKIPGDVSAKVLNIGLELFNAGKRLLAGVETAFDTAMGVFNYESPYWEDTKARAELYEMTREEYHDLWFDLLTDMENEASSIVSDSKSGGLPEAMEDPADTETDAAESGEATPQAPLRKHVVLFYGYTEVTLNSTDTFESLAAEYLGSPDMAVYIAVYNGVASIDELNPGDAIKIPVLTPSGRHLLNRIYARPEDRDNYGRDIYLDNEGYTAASTSGDYLLTDGVENLNQAILLRLRESVAKRIRLNAYGIRTNISDPTAGIAYIISSIGLTVGRDPRVSAVDTIKFAGAGDGLDVRVEYTDINHNNGSAAGRV